MERNEHYYSSNYNQQRQGSGRDNSERYSDRYSSQGNYYGMPNAQEYGNVRMQQRSDFNEFSEGPVGGYGAGNYNESYDRVHRNRDDHFRYGDDNHFKQSHGYSNQGDYRNEDFRNRSRNSQDYDRGQQYSSNYDVAGNRRYARQENSYDNPGHGRRYSEYGRDERYNYGHELTDIHHDRREPRNRRHDNDYGRNYRPDNRFDYGDRKEDYRFSGRIENSNSDHGDRDRKSNQDRHPSGPDYSKQSPIGGYGYQTFGI